MYQTPDDENVFVQYTIINDDCLYETQSYNIMQNGTYVDHGKYKKDSNNNQFVNLKTNFSYSDEETGRIFN